MSCVLSHIGRGIVIAGCALAVAVPPAAAESERVDLCMSDRGDCSASADADDAPGDPWRRPNHVRAGLELGVVLGVGAAWYWIERDRQVADWDFPSWRDRFSRDVFINDNNPFMVNYSWHTLGGSAYQVFARANDLGLLEATALNLGTSLAWEYGIEYREKISINDILFTTWAGVAFGEFVHWLGRYTQQLPEGRTGSAARWTAGIAQTAHDAIDGRRGPRGPNVQHEFRLSSGLAYGSAERRDGDESSQSTHLYHLRFEGELAALDDYLRVGRGGAMFRDGNLTTMDVKLTSGPEGSGTHVLADTLLVGWRHQDIPAPGAGVIGTAAGIGTSVAVRYQRDQYGIWDDRLGAAHLPGLALDGDLLGDGWRLRGKARLHGDYVGVNAMSLDRWNEAHPDEVGKSILRHQGYYYGWGWSGRLKGELSTSRLGLGGTIFYGRYRSQQGFDRHQEEVTVDQVARDRFVDYELWLRGAIYRDVFVELRRSGHYRQASFEEFDGSARLLRHTIEMGTYF